MISYVLLAPISLIYIYIYVCVLCRYVTALPQTRIATIER